MTNLSRRSFVGGATAGVAALGAATSVATPLATPERAGQLVYRSSDWRIAEFERLVGDATRIKQVFDPTQIGEGRFLNGIKNSLNGLEFGFNIPVKQIKVVAAMHGPANLLNFDDYVWKKYRVGEWLKVKDPKTDEPAVRNPFQGSRVPRETQKSGQDPNDEDRRSKIGLFRTCRRGVCSSCVATLRRKSSHARSSSSTG
jgi:hypothetical protein